jgi:hypothetical protein
MTQRGHRRTPATGLKYEDLIILDDVSPVNAKEITYRIRTNKFDIENKTGTLDELRDFLYLTDEYLDGKMDFVSERLTKYKGSLK